AGRILISAKPFREEIINYEFNLNNLNDAKEKFPSWKDSDEFEIK
ncbi:MAG: nitrilase family protein, partial [Bacteroidetes bacterium]|nr:nitrilase family protein [Bacteroidota bacterium]